MPGLRAALGWPWHWLNEASTTPGNVEVPASITPVVSVNRRTPCDRFTFRSAILLAPSVVNVVTLSAPPVGHHKIWTRLNFVFDVNKTGVIDFTQLNLFLDGNTTIGPHVLFTKPAAGLLALSQEFSIIGGFQGTDARMNPLYQRSRDVITLSVPTDGTAPGTGVLTVRGVFVEAPENEPIYSEPGQVGS